MFSKFVTNSINKTRFKCICLHDAIIQSIAEIKMRVPHSKLLFTCLISSQSILTWARTFTSKFESATVTEKKLREATVRFLTVASRNFHSKNFEKFRKFELATVFEQNHGGIDNTDELYEWNRWQGMVACPENTHIHGMSVKVETPVQGGGDNTALNGIKILCAPSYKSEAKYYKETVVTVVDGGWGEWSNMVKCDPYSAPFDQNSILKNLVVRAEKYIISQK